ncbi:MAG: YfiR family protein [Candidatus Omnitrophica bacterium]|nr:YfiR family protein [Candidatus Omnitrophota bacterium]
MKNVIKIIFICFFIGCPKVYSQGSATENDIKTAFIFHFLNYTEWNDDSSELNVCIEDDTDLRSTAKVHLDERVIKGRTIKVVRKAASCHILISEVSPDTDHMLTIGNLSDGAVFEFRKLNDKLRFAVNLAKVKESKLKISSQLLKLAIVEE